MKDEKNIEDKAVCTDIHELVKREVNCQNKAFMIAYFTGEERSNKKQNDIIYTLESVVPNRTRLIVDNVLTKAAIIILYLLLLGCTGSS